MDSAPILKRMAAFALVILVLYYTVLSFVQARENGQLLRAQTAALAKANQERAELIKIAIAQNEAIRKLGGKPVNPFDGPSAQTPTSIPVPLPSPAPRAAPPRAAGSPRPHQSPVPSSSPRPRPRPTTSPKPAPSPTPNPAPKPLLCAPPPLQDVCTPV